jgi:multimeric flavodoxin WrbA
MKILVIHGSPRKKGNTMKFFQRIFNPGSGDEVRSFSLVDLDIHPCTGCLACFEKGECIFQDDMVRIHEETRWADQIIFTTPVYFNTVSSYMKLMMDRFQRDYARRFILKLEPRVEAGKSGILLATAGSVEKHHEFDGLRFPADLMFKSQGIRDYRVILLDDVDEGRLEERMASQKKLYT